MTIRRSKTTRTNSTVLRCRSERSNTPTSPRKRAHVLPDRRPKRAASYPTQALTTYKTAQVLTIGSAMSPARTAVPVSLPWDAVLRATKAPKTSICAAKGLRLYGGVTRVAVSTDGLKDAVRIPAGVLRVEGTGRPLEGDIWVVQGVSKGRSWEW